MNKFRNTLLRNISKAVELNIISDNILPTNLEKITLQQAEEIACLCGFKLSTFIDVSLGEMDFAQKRKASISEKYLHSAGSKLRTSLVILDLIKEYYGIKFARNCALHLDLNPQLNSKEILKEDPNCLVNIKLIDDLMIYLNQRGIYPFELMKLGLLSVEHKHNSWLKDKFKKCRNIPAVFEFLFDELIKEYELNFDYKISKSNRDSITIEVTPKEERVDDFKSPIIDHPPLSFYRQGAIVAHCKLASLPIPRVINPERKFSKFSKHPFKETFKVQWTG